MKIFYFYTDGATEPTNPGPSAFAFVETASNLDNQELFSYSEFIGHSTNNIAELQAIRAVLMHIKTNLDRYTNNKIYIYSDSQYAIDSITKWYPTWVAKNKLADKKNVELIKEMYELFMWLRPSVSIDISWVKGHNGTWGNERADQLCTQACFKGRGETLEDTPEQIFDKLIESSYNLFNSFNSNLDKLKVLYNEIHGSHIESDDLMKLITSRDLK